MSTDEKIRALALCMQMSVDNSKQQGQVNKLQADLNQQILDILETQSHELKALRALVKRLSSWSHN